LAARLTGEPKTIGLNPASRKRWAKRDRSEIAMSKLSRSMSRIKQLALALQPFSANRQITARRSLLWKLLKDHADTISFERNGIHWCGPVRSSITAALFTEGNYQHDCIAPLLTWLELQPRWRDSHTILNVGANIGDTCIALAMQTGKQVLACEPVPELFEILQRNVGANHLQDRIACHRLAIAARVGQAEIVCPREPEYSEIRGQSGAQGFHHPEDQCQVFSVPTITLDALLQREGLQSSNVGLVWSDTQGFESEVIESGATLWQAGVPLWVEVWPRGLNAHGGVEKFLSMTERFFRSFVPESTLLREARVEAEPTSALPALVQSLSGRAFTDILLIP
jgi:FkbM family methyltransferase